MPAVAPCGQGVVRRRGLALSDEVEPSVRLLISMWLVGQVVGAVRAWTDRRDVDQASGGREDGRDVVAATTLHPQSHRIMSAVWQSCPRGFG